MTLATLKQSQAGRLVLTWLFYVVAGVVSVMLASPVDHVSPLFLSAGMALACVVAWGGRMLGAVALGGATVVVFDHLLHGSPMPPGVWGLVVVAGAGGAVQAWLGWWLLRRVVTQPVTLDEPRDVLHFVILAGPVACLVNSGLCASYISLFHLLPGAHGWSVFATWWFGDAMGVLIGTPIALTMIGQPSQAWRGRRLTVAVPLALATTLMVLAMAQVRRWDDVRLRGVFERDASTTFSEMRLRLQRYADAVEALHGVYMSSDSVTRDEFRRAVAPWQSDLTGLQALVWAEPLMRNDRDAFEAAQVKEGVAGYRVFDAPRGSEPQDDQWAVVRFIEPQLRNTSVLGLNIRSLPNAWDALQLAASSDRAVVSAPYRLLAARNHEYGVVMARAVLKTRPPDAPRSGRDLNGYVLAVVRVDEAIERLLQGMPPYLAACLVDVGALKQGQYANLLDLPECQTDAFERADVRQTMDLPVMGRTWQLRMWARNQVPIAVHGYHWLIGACGMALSAALGSLLLSMTGRTRRIEVAVKDRTARLEFEISERHQTEQALRESEQRFRAIFDSVPIGVVYTDLDGNIRQANPGFCALTGYAESDLVGMSLQTLAHPEDRDFGGTLRDQLLRGDHSVITRSQRYLTRSGQTRQVHISMRLLQNGTAKPLGLVGVVEDVTERMRLHESERAREAAEASNRAKSEFLSRMSHELRTPLNAMLGFAQLLDLDSQAPLPALQKGWVAQIQRAGWHLLDMINDVLDLSRIDAGTFRLELTPQSVVELVDGASQLVETQAQHRHVTVSCSREGLAVPPVLADVTRAKQILSNLLSNAIKYNREGGSVTVSARVMPSQEVAIDVTDTGMGMTSSQMRELFQPFNRLGRERSATEGTGIGLVISRRLAELMGGSLTVQSEAGKGSTFSLVLPVAKAGGAASKPAEPDESPYALAAAVYHRRRVIYIEDNETNASVMAGVFAQRPQVDFEVCRTATDGLAAVAQSAPDLILLDMQLPDISGMDVLARLKADMQTADIPVVMVSADVLSGQIQEALAAGAVHYLTKPVDVAEVLAVVDHLLERVETVS